MFRGRLTVLAKQPGAIETGQNGRMLDGPFKVDKICISS
jgi:hypothetical protein